MSVIYHGLERENGRWIVRETDGEEGGREFSSVPYLPRSDSAENIDDAVGLLLSFLGIPLTEQAAAAPGGKGENKLLLQLTLPCFPRR